MKKLIVLLILMCGFAPLSWAVDGCNEHLTPEEFRAKQKAYITEKAGLTKEEAAKFFPIYFELQDRKKQLNDEAWKLLRKGKDKRLPKRNIPRFWKACMTPVLPPIVWRRTILRNSKRFCQVRRYTRCCMQRCALTVSC